MAVRHSVLGDHGENLPFFEVPRFDPQPNHQTQLSISIALFGLAQHFSLSFPFLFRTFLVAHVSPPKHDTEQWVALWRLSGLVCSFHAWRFGRRVSGLSGQPMSSGVVVFL